MSEKDNIAIIREKLAVVKAINPEITKCISMYSSNKEGVDITLLENIKSEMLGHLMTVSDAHSYLKFQMLMYKEGRKIAKSKSIEILVDEGKGATNAGNLAYSEKSYTVFMKSYKIVTQAFEHVNSKYYLLDTALNAITQSIAVLRVVTSKAL